VKDEFKLFQVISAKKLPEYPVKLEEQKSVLLGIKKQ